MKKILLLALISTSTFAQKFSKMPESKMQGQKLEAELRFIASDEMLGRKTGSITNKLAARYIAEQFRANGILPAPGTDNYLQKIGFENLKAVKEGTIISNMDTLKMIKQFVGFGGSDDFEVSNSEVVFAGYGWVDETKGLDDYKNLDIKGKIVVTRAGTEDSKSPQELFSAAQTKRKLAKDRGAIAVIEIFGAAIPWPTVAGFFGGENIALAESEPQAKRLPLYWISGTAGKEWTKDKINMISISVPKREKTNLQSSNVVGILEGTDPILKKEYVILSAHFDHIGYGKAAGAVTADDSIFNGTRDNALGTMALLEAARSLSTLKPKRSIIFLAFTGEEIGLLGSKYYAEHPLVPLKDCVFNLNCDGAGYNETSSIVLIGLNRIDTDPQLHLAAKAVNLVLKSDPAPEQNLFDRSDNVSFAAKGIPSPTLSPGFMAFDDAINKYYHKAADNPESVDFEYLKKYCQVFSYGARLIANRASKPRWVTGDKYEKAFNILYAMP